MTTLTVLYLMIVAGTAIGVILLLLKLSKILLIESLSNKVIKEYTKYLTSSEFMKDKMAGKVLEPGEDKTHIMAFLEVNEGFFLRRCGDLNYVAARCHDIHTKHKLEHRYQK